MASHKKFDVKDFKGIEVECDWDVFDVIVAVCDEAKKMISANKAQELPVAVRREEQKMVSANKAQELPVAVRREEQKIEPNNNNAQELRKLSRKRSSRVLEKNKSFKNVKESDEQERPVKKLRGYNHSQETEAEEITRKSKRKRVKVSMPALDPEKDKKELNKAQKKAVVSILEGTYELPDEYKEKIKSMNQTGDAKLVIQKMLYHADVKDDQNRFSIPMKKLRCTDFLTDEERKLIEERMEDNHLKCIKVKVIEPNEELSVVEATFRKWDLNKGAGKASHSYLLNGGWKEIRKRNNLKVHTFMQLWTFREKGNLCFALVKIPVDMQWFKNLV